MTLAEMMASDADEQNRSVAPRDEQLVSISELAQRQAMLELSYSESIVEQLIAEHNPSVPELEEALRRRKEELSKVKEFDLPNAMESLRMSSFDLRGWGTISVKEDVYSAITEQNREAAFKWLVDTDNDGIIKASLTSDFGKGQEDDARALAKLLDDAGFSYSSKRNVHPQTLKAFVRKRLEAGEPVPVDLFSVHVKKVATVKLAR